MNIKVKDTLNQKEFDRDGGAGGAAGAVAPSTFFQM